MVDSDQLTGLSSAPVAGPRKRIINWPRAFSRCSSRNASRFAANCRLVFSVGAIVSIPFPQSRFTSSFSRACLKRRWMVLRLTSSGCRKPADRKPCRKTGSSSGFVLISKSVFRGTSRVSDRLECVRLDKATGASRIRRHQLRRGRTCRVCTWKAVAGLWVGVFGGSKPPRHTSGKASSASENEPGKVKKSQHY